MSEDEKKNVIVTGEIDAARLQQVMNSASAALEGAKATLEGVPVSGAVSQMQVASTQSPGILWFSDTRIVDAIGVKFDNDAHNTRQVAQLLTNGVLSISHYSADDLTTLVSRTRLNLKTAAYVEMFCPPDPADGRHYMIRHNGSIVPCAFTQDAALALMEAVERLG